MEDHWDDLTIRSWATIDGVRVLYQDSPMSALRTPRDLIRRQAGADVLPAGTLMFCGTPGAIGGIRPGSRFEMEIMDPVLKRSLTMLTTSRFFRSSHEPLMRSKRVSSAEA